LQSTPAVLVVLVLVFVPGVVLVSVVVVESLPPPPHAVSPIPAGSSAAMQVANANARPYGKVDVWFAFMIHSVGLGKHLLCRG